MKNALVIKLTLQPLIENSIMHSFQSNISGQRIDIDIYKESEDTIILSVSDNGIGMDKECLPEDIRIIDPLSGNIYNLPDDMLENLCNGHIKIKNVPILDYPLFITFGNFT